MTQTPAWMIATALIAGALASPALAADCRGEIRGATAIVGTRLYNPFSPADLSDSHRIAVANVGSQPCRFALLFRSSAAQPKLGGMLLYQLFDPGNAALITNMPAALAPLARLNSALAASQVGNFEFRFALPRGQAAAPRPALW